MRYAMQGLATLKEFCFTQQVTRSWDPMPWASANTLKTLIMVDVTLNLGILSDRIGKMQVLETLFIAFPMASTGELDPLALAYDRGPNKCEIILAVTGGESAYVGFVMHSVDERWMSMFRIMDLSELGDRRIALMSRTRWLLRAIADGAISGRPTMSWNEFVASSRPPIPAR